jgi:hypothetical protein
VALGSQKTGQVVLYPFIGFSFQMISGYLPFLMVGLLLAAFFSFLPGKRKTGQSFWG